MKLRDDHEYIKELEAELLELDYFRCAECGYVYHVNLVSDGIRKECAQDVCHNCEDYYLKIVQEEKDHREQMWADGHAGHFFSTSK